MDAFAKIRAALEFADREYSDKWTQAETNARDELMTAALATLAELERAAKVPAWYTVADGSLLIDREDYVCGGGLVGAIPLYTAPPAPAAAPQFEAVEVDDAMAHRIAETVFDQLGEGRVCADDGRKMIAAVRAELGPLVEMREPSDDECHQMWDLFTDQYAEQFLKPSDSVDIGRAIFDAARDVMWPKGGEG